MTDQSETRCPTCGSQYPAASQGTAAQCPDPFHAKPKPKMYAVPVEVLNALALELPAEVHADVMRRAVLLP